MHRFRREAGGRGTGCGGRGPDPKPSTLKLAGDSLGPKAFVLKTDAVFQGRDRPSLEAFRVFSRKIRFSSFSLAFSYFSISFHIFTVVFHIGFRIFHIGFHIFTVFSIYFSLGKI